MSRVFIVEDDDSLQILFKRSFDYAGYEVAGLASNGVKAIDMYKAFSKKPDVIIIDHHIPIKDGIEVIKEIKKLSGESKIIIISGDPRVEKQALSAGANFFLEKPFSFTELINTVNCLVS